MGADANGFYLTTNEYAFFPDNIFHAAQVYVLEAGPGRHAQEPQDAAVRHPG
jgi:hypothetical protein